MLTQLLGTDPDRVEILEGLFEQLRIARANQQPGFDREPGEVCAVAVQGVAEIFSKYVFVGHDAQISRRVPGFGFGEIGQLIGDSSVGGGGEGPGEGFREGGESGVLERARAGNESGDSQLRDIEGLATGGSRPGCVEEILRPKEEDFEVAGGLGDIAGADIILRSFGKLAGERKRVAGPGGEDPPGSGRDFIEGLNFLTSIFLSGEKSGVLIAGDVGACRSAGQLLTPRKSVQTDPDHDVDREEGRNENAEKRRDQGAWHEPIGGDGDRVWRGEGSNLKACGVRK